MLVGHVAAGFAAKRVAPRLSLGAAVLAALLADLLFNVFVFTGIERIEIGTGRGAANYFHPLNIAYSHSLLSGILWAALLAGMYFALRHDRRAAWVLAAAVLSHWVLDFIAHRGDMPLAPGVHLNLGLGLWTSIPATLVVEGGLALLAITLYLRATRPRGRLAHFVFWIVFALIVLAWYGNISGPPPANPRVAPVSSFVFFSLVVAWAYWVDRLRPECERIRA